MKLIFNEIIINQLTIDEELFKEYLNYCEKDDMSPDKDDFIDWLNENIYISDLINDEEWKYSLTKEQFTDYLKNFDK